MKKIKSSILIKTSSFLKRNFSTDEQQASPALSRAGSVKSTHKSISHLQNESTDANVTSERNSMLGTAQKAQQLQMRRKTPGFGSETDQINYNEISHSLRNTVILNPKDPAISSLNNMVSMCILPPSEPASRNGSIIDVSSRSAADLKRVSSDFNVNQPKLLLNMLKSPNGSQIPSSSPSDSDAPTITSATFPDTLTHAKQFSSRPNSIILSDKQRENLEMKSNSNDDNSKRIPLEVPHKKERRASSLRNVAMESIEYESATSPNGITDFAG